MKAIVMQGEPGKASLVDRPFPKLRPGYVLVDVKAVALNPTDWKHIDFINTKGSLSGCDFAGVVAETGTGYSKQWKVGDRIAGFANGGNNLQPEDGSFAERIAVKADVAIRIPDSLSFEEAATLGVGVITCGQGLFQKMGLQRPSQPTTKGEFILIYGGSSATGTLGIQFAKLAGYTPITTCSSRNFDLVKSLGAVAAFDYKDPDVASQIKQFTNNDLHYVWDTISLPASAQLSAEVIAPGGRYGSLLPVKFPRDDVKATDSLGYTAMGEPIERAGYSLPASTADFEFAKNWVTEVEALLQQGRLKVHPHKVGKGLENVFDGLHLLRHDKVSGQKLVYVL
ncbi:hypothetical protein A1O3_09100 [Capronia epimyces CBS 606.96]|uniref:Enoyl reductase (ER) domain-containing protein n=1 Tax=Capronia epimyces CBS 606.96 TaxID=1182542 RepID=W9XLV2_9EURO|nr:uncharacterized protein A1O3_09100 [Capronia epimyces CBS 606.96]EXJ77941.1 hypothetical protein A1O3_09100 [Capronia epimyces CBS 606.96]